MIQRIQTLFMLISAILSGLLFVFDLASFDYGQTVMNLSILGVDNQTDAIYFSSYYTIPLLALAIIMIVLPIFTSFKYKKRSLQVKLCQLDMFINVIFIVLVLVYYVSDISGTIAADTVKYCLGIYIPLVSLVLNILAIRGIKKDIELLKSVDRIR